LRAAVSALAFIAALAALLLLGGGGLVLFVVPGSGEATTGVLLAASGIVAFVLTMVLLFARPERFQDPTRRAGAVAGAVIAAVPAAGLAVAAFRFARLPLGSPAPLLDWAVFAAGVVMALGALSIIALGARRAREMPGPPPVIHMQQIRDAQRQLRSALNDSALLDQDEGYEVRVTRV
jgi:hypothetical protein